MNYTSTTMKDSAHNVKDEQNDTALRMAVTTKEMAAPRLLPSYRLAITVMSACALLLSSMSQSTLGAAIVCMVTSDPNNTNTTDKLDWDKATQGWIHSARFLVYYICQLPSGFLTSHMSGRVMTIVGLVVMGTFDVLTAPTARWGLAPILLARCLQGAGNALVTTGSVCIVGKWIPASESSFLYSFIGAGFMGGTSLAFLFSSIACEHMGWSYIFYFTGGLSLVYAVLWCPLTDEEPSVSRWAGQQEKEYVLAFKKDEVFRGKIPWAAMFRSGPLYGVVLGQIAGDWLLYFSFTVAPSYFSNVLHLSNGVTDLVSGVPFFLLIPATALFGHILDVFRQKELLSTVDARRLAEGVFCLVPAACCVVLALMPASQSTAAVAVYTLCILAYMGLGPGWMANLNDLAPLLSGVTMAVSQALAAWMDFFVPVFVDYVTADETKEQWNTVFYVTAGLQVFCFAGFCILSSGELQPWAKSEECSSLITFEKK